MEKERGFVEKGIILVLGLFILILFLALGMYLDKTLKHGVGWVWQDKKGSVVKQFLKEEDGCVLYINVWDKQSKACGSYVIEKY